MLNNTVNTVQGTISKGKINETDTDFLEKIQTRKWFVYAELLFGNLSEHTFSPNTHF